MRRQKSVTVVVASFFLFLGISSEAVTSSPVSIRVSPNVIMAPLGKNVSPNVIIMIERHPDNRWLEVTWGDESSSLRQVDGEKAKRIFDEFSGHVSLGPGRHVITARIRRSDGQEYSASQTITIYGEGFDEPNQ